MNKEYCFILIDDVAMNNLLSRYILKNNYPNALVVEFTDPQLGLDYVQKECNTTNNILYIILLDIYMPVTDGWDFLDSFEKFNDDIKKNCAIYVLSSSINKADSDKAKANKYVTGYALKPLTDTIIKDIVNEIEKTKTSF